MQRLLVISVVIFWSTMADQPGPHCSPHNQEEQASGALDVLNNVFHGIYPDQPNPLSFTALIKYWLGGPDPLDYVDVYDNPGNPELGVPPHWHYISLGLSDLYGDNRIHFRAGPGEPSGFGFELTFKLAKKSGETNAPAWPGTLMQSLARYVFKSGNILHPGDHIPWHGPLGQGSGRISQLLMTKDTQLPDTVSTPNGDVTFVQIIGITPEELKAAQHWNGAGVANLLKSLDGGGPWLVTDIHRVHSIMEQDPTAAEKIQMGIERDGSSLGEVSAECWWDPITDENIWNKYREPKPENSDNEDEGSCKLVKEPEAEPSNPDASVETKKESPSGSKEGAPCPGEANDLKILPGIRLKFNLEAASLLPLVIKGRIKHGRHFTFKALDHSMITFIPPTITHIHTPATLDKPYAATGTWLHVLISDELATKMADEFQIFNVPDQIPLPKTFTWPEYKLEITVVNNSF